MVCASLCLSQSYCIGFEIVDYGICRRIAFIWDITEINEDSNLAKKLWLSETFIENYPQLEIDLKQEGYKKVFLNMDTSKIISSDDIQQTGM